LDALTEAESCAVYLMVNLDLNLRWINDSSGCQETGAIVPGAQQCLQKTIAN
jgi:hypothetical protein